MTRYAPGARLGLDAAAHRMIRSSSLTKAFYLALAVAFAGLAEARHIVGGEVTYECLGESGGDRRYRVTVTMYRDCGADGALFDSDGNQPNSTPFEMTIFRGSTEVSRVGIPRSGLTIELLDPNLTNPCIELPPGVCVERGTYVTEVVLPIVGETYTISYQRCCRNESISNILQPGAAGATYLAEVTPEAQRSCNSTPVFDQFPPIVICADEVLRFDAGATDPEGDRLVYSLCEPFYGGGVDGTPGNPGNPNGPTGVAPNPETPPPYDPVIFRPRFNFENPLDGSISIDPNTGFLEALPLAIGQYVVCISVREFRGDELIGEVRRDFQFNVVACDPRINAGVAAAVDGDLADPNRILVCGEREVTLVDVSTDQAFIREVGWSIPNTSAGLFEATGPSATVGFDDFGAYPGRLIVNPGLACVDTADFTLVLVPPTEVDFALAFDTCEYGPVRLASLAATETDGIVDYAWDLGDGTELNGENVSHLYAGGGRRAIRHAVTDLAGCVTDTVRDLEFFPLPPVLEFDIGGEGACAPALVPFAFGGGVVTEEYDTFWSFGDGATSTAFAPRHAYPEPGFYDIFARVISPAGCALDSQLLRPLEILETPTAAFTYAPEPVDTRDPEVVFTDRSLLAASWEWTFDSLGKSRETDPTWVFPDSGNYVVQLVVTHLNDCPDTTVQLLRVDAFQSLFLPNAFAPDGNGDNVAFRPAGVLRYVTDFRMEIYNRWGERIYETGDMEAGWDGTNQRNGRRATPGVYLYLVSHGGIEGLQRYEGTVTLVE